MALITSRTAVHIPIYVRVVEVARVVVAMATRALENREVTRIDVTRGTLAVGVAMTGWETRVVSVWECATGPVIGADAVAGPALRNREEGGIRSRGMGYWTCSLVVIALMARAARVAGQVVIVVHVAIGAYPRRHGVHSHQCEARVVVIKRGIGPVNRVVAGFARRGESS